MRAYFDVFVFSAQVGAESIILTTCEIILRKRRPIQRKDADPDTRRVRESVLLLSYSPRRYAIRRYAIRRLNVLLSFVVSLHGENQ
jgi:hypothetical protein